MSIDLKDGESSRFCEFSSASFTFGGQDLGSVIRESPGSVIEKALPFGLRLAPKIFSTVADTMQWNLLKKGMVNSLH